MDRLNIMKGFILAFVLGIFPAVSVYGQYLETSKEAPVREDSLSSTDIIARIDAGTALRLVDDLVRLYGTGYWHIELPTGGDGFVYKTHVRLIDDDFPGSAPSPDSPATGELQVHVINVGQGDGILVICPDGNHQMVIDAGDLNYGVRYPGSETEFRNYIRAFQDENDPIKVVIATHPHSDHIAGMKWLLQTYETGLYVDNGRAYDSGTYSSLETVIIDENINRKRLTDPVVPEIDFCPRQDVTARILRPEGFDEPGMDDNDYSVIVRLDYGSKSFLFTGDAEHLMEEKLLADPNTAPYLDVDWLKTGHHGSHSSSTEAFIEMVSPEIAAISSGGEGVYTNSGYRHPRMITLDMLFPYTRDRSGIPTTLEAYSNSTGEWTQTITKESVFITNNDGDLVFLSDGSNIWYLGDE